MCVSSVLEGVGLSMLVPLLAQLGVDSSSTISEGGKQDVVGSILSVLHVPNELGPLMTVLVCILLLQVASTFLLRFLEAYSTTQYTAKWQERLFASVINANWPYLQASRPEVQVNQIVSESSRNSAALSLLLQMMNSCFYIFVYSVIACFTAWQVVVGLVVAGGLIFVITRPISDVSRKTSAEVTTVSEGLYGCVQDFLQNAKLVKATATEVTALGDVNRAIGRYRQIFLRAGVIPALMQAIYMGFGYVLLAAGVWFGIARAEIPVSAVVVTIYIFLRLYTQLSNFQQLRQSYLLSASALTNCKNELEKAEAAAEHQPVIERPWAPSGAAEVELNNVSVFYDETIALDKVSMAIPAGSVVGLAGPSGAGKSTLVDLIVGLAMPTSGELSVEGQLIQSIPMGSWRRQIGYVSQETLIIKGTVASNIAWGDVSANREDIENAAKMANAHEFIMGMPDGYDTVIGGRAIRMSGGQRQRIGLARALIGAKKLLILDEATSALDAESESKLLQAVDELRGGISIIMIAHRLSTLKHVDKIYVLDEGRVIESGTLQDLISSNGMFSKLWALQFSKNEDL
ncbi:ABC transporter ATP-binding protein [Thalassospira tepidiphila]|uniref:ABC transporter ATP-binding protein n=1 Tax=Thalassospira tepidiphila TaxID=393657 RepID=UPI00237C2885|nr:ABC transporter ATP-binding protein [Thalassospira tepidiphila]